MQNERFISSPRCLRHNISREEFDDVHSSTAPASKLERYMKSFCGSVDPSTEIRLSTSLNRQRCGQGGAVDLNKKRVPHLIDSQEVSAEPTKCGKFNEAKRNVTTIPTHTSSENPEMFFQSLQHSCGSDFDRSKVLEIQPVFTKHGRPCTNVARRNCKSVPPERGNKQKALQTGYGSNSIWPTSKAAHF